MDCQTRCSLQGAWIHELLRTWEPELEGRRAWLTGALSPAEGLLDAAAAAAAALGPSTASALEPCNSGQSLQSRAVHACFACSRWLFMLPSSL